MMEEEILKQLSDMQAKQEVSEQHIRDMATQVNQLDHMFTDILDKLGRVERKTATLADVPGRKNCPHCTRIVNNPTAKACPHCGHPLYT
jgi:hypothetical protein